MIYFIIFLLLIVLELGYFKLADRFNIIDKPNLRSSHTSVTLRGGGIIFLIGTWIWAILFGFQYPWFLLGLTAVGAVSFIDDVHSTPNWLRLIVQFGAMMLMFVSLGLFTASYWWLIIPALIVCVGIVNAYNFMDGINGITGCYSLAVLVPLLWLNYHLDFIDNSFLIVASLSVVVFLFFNFRKRAKCFAGDVGSVSIAFIVLFALGKLIMATSNPVYLLFLGVYGADSILTIIHRIKLHEKLGEAHRKHAYQLMSNELHVPHTVVSLIYLGLQLAISAGLILIRPEYQWSYFFATIILLALGYVIFMKKNYHLHEEYLKSKGLC